MNTTDRWHDVEVRDSDGRLIATATQHEPLRWSWECALCEAHGVAHVAAAVAVGMIEDHQLDGARRLTQLERPSETRSDPGTEAPGSLRVSAGGHTAHNHERVASERRRRSATPTEVNERWQTRSTTPARWPRSR